MIPSTLSHLQVNGRTQYLTYCLGRSSSAVPVFVSPPAPGMMRETIGEFVAMGEPVERSPFAGSFCRERPAIADLTFGGLQLSASSPI
jgi:hypothetical protein